jgi:uncharacterized protein (DUF433 family)
MNYNQYISTDPDILRGKLCIAGTRISVEMILEMLALDDSVNDILDAYSHIPLTREQVLAAIRFAHDRIHDEYSQECAQKDGPRLSHLLTQSLDKEAIS